MSVKDIADLFRTEFPQLYDHELDDYRLEEVSDMTARMRLHVGDRHLRPGNTVSGPALMTAADLAIYCAILAQIGPKVLTVTTNLNFNFMRKPVFADIIANARILKLGKSLVVAECDLISSKTDEIVAHVTGTYSIPPNE